MEIKNLRQCRTALLITFGTACAGLTATAYGQTAPVNSGGAPAQLPAAAAASPITIGPAAGAGGGSVIPVAAAGEAEYRLAPDDVLNISVVNFPNLSLSLLVIPPDGKISVPLLTPVSVAGRTVAEVTEDLTRQWRKYLIEPSVFVSLAQKRHENIVVYGFVLRPGGLDYRAPMRALDAIAQSGGALPLADMSHVTITCRDGQKRTSDLSHPENRSGTENDVVLKQGDAIYVPEKRTQFSVIGEVTRPGSYDYREDMTVLDALTAVGGVVDVAADLEAATLVHNGVQRPIDLDALLRRGDMTINVKLSPGDRLMIPEARKRVYVFGAVEHPGYYNLRKGDHILDALHSCGGPLPEANLKSANLVHIDATKNTGVAEDLNIDKLLSEGNMKANIELQPGDVLYIPTKRKKMQWTDMWVVLSGLNLLNTGAQIANKGLGN